MKHLLLLFTVFYTLTLSATENKLKQSWITSGSELIYEVNAFGDVYDFVVYLDEVGDAISFDYYMTNDNATEGYISIPASAMADATSHMNYFSGGERTLEGQTTVFFSRGAFSDMVNGKTITIDVGRGTLMTVRRQTPDEIQQMHEELLADTYMPYGGIYYVDGVDVLETFFEDHILLVDVNTGAHVYTVLNDPDFPLITYMNLGWEIELIEVFTP